MNAAPTALITGASSGIGRELSRVFAAKGYRLVLVARARNRLEEVASELKQAHDAEVVVESCDLSNRSELEDLIQRLKARFTSESRPLDVLVNNAGFGVEGNFAETKWEDERELIDLNVMALVRLTKAFLPAMVARGSGRILQVASTAAFQPGPRLALYFASKAFVLSFAEAISVELVGTGVSVTALCPGPTDTGFEKRLGGSSALFESGLPVADAKRVAEAGYDSLIAGKRVAIIGNRNRFLVWLGRLVPASFTLWVVSRLMRKKKSFRANHMENVSTL